MLKRIKTSKLLNKNSIGIFISLLFLILIFYNININQVLDSMKSFNAWYALPAFGFYTLSYIVRAIRWKELLSVSKSINYSSVLKAVYIGYMANTLLPARMGELYRAHIIGTEQNIKRSSALASIVAERVFDGLTLVCLMAILIIFFYNKPWLVNILLTTGSIFAFSFIVILLASKKSSIYDNILTNLFKILPAFIKNKLESILTSFIVGLGVLKSFKALVFIVLTSIIVWTLEGVTTYFIVSGFDLGIHISPVIIAFLIVLGAFSTMIPSGPAFVGPYQYAFILALGLSHVSKDAALAVAVTSQALMIGPVVIIGMILLWKSHLSLLYVPNKDTVESDNMGENS